jgi:hypothetical protein
MASSLYWRDLLFHKTLKEVKMDIHAKKGTKVIFANPNAGYDHHQKTAKEHLTVGETYTLDRTEVRAYHTDVFLKEIPGIAFNSVMFEKE